VEPGLQPGGISVGRYKDWITFKRLPEAGDFSGRQDAGPPAGRDTHRYFSIRR
jgi:hypothetical protein